MKSFIPYLLCVIVLLGCAHVQVEAPKDPIKMDIAMRLDVYQHVVKDIDAIEDIVKSGTPGLTAKLGDLIVPPANAADIDPVLREAALRRRDRLGRISDLEAQGVIGESRTGLLVLRGRDADAEGLIQSENSDRLLIYRTIARQNGTTVEDVQKPYSVRLQSDAPSGTPIQTQDGEWSIK